MNLTLAGISHRSLPVEVRERLNIPGLQLQAALKELLASAAIREALILSTCNRVEVAVAGDDGFATEPGYGAFWRSITAAIRQPTTATCAGIATATWSGICFG
jgi:glutamyl-tRNA reductase